MKFKIVGMGPGHKDYVLPIAKRALDSADVIIGGKRHIAEFANTDKILISVEGKFAKLPSIIREHMVDKKVVVAVSGDTGFYSLLTYLKKHFEAGEFEVVLGISSMQYMYSKVCMTYQDAFIGSVHGRELDYISLVSEYESVGLLTDAQNSPQNIAKSLYDAGKQNIYMYVGERLSYDDEVLSEGYVVDIKDREFDVLSVVILVEGNTGGRNE